MSLAAAQGPLDSLLDRRIVIVTGKGGTGKTTVCAALALAAAKTGRRVLVAEVGRDEQIPRLLVPGAPPAGYAGRELLPGVRAMRIDPYAALGEYLGLHLGVPAVVNRVLESGPFQQLMSAAPGWRELITLGKVWHLERMREASGKPRFDLIIVDAPATGHGVTFLDAPRVVVSAVRSGPLRTQSQDVEDLIKDSARCVVLPVTLAEELPARETAELVAKTRDELGVAVDRVVINAMAPAPFPEGLERLDRALADLDCEDLPAKRMAPLVQCSAYLRARFELNQGFAREIEKHTALPSVRLPLVTEGFEDPDRLASLGAPLIAAPGDLTR